MTNELNSHCLFLPGVSGSGGGAGLSGGISLGSGGISLVSKYTGGAKVLLVTRILLGMRGIEPFEGETPIGGLGGGGSGGFCLKGRPDAGRGPGCIFGSLFWSFCVRVYWVPVLARRFGDELLFDNLFPGGFGGGGREIGLFTDFTICVFCSSFSSFDEDKS